MEEEYSSHSEFDEEEAAQPFELTQSIEKTAQGLFATEDSEPKSNYIEPQEPMPEEEAEPEETKSVSIEEPPPTPLRSPRMRSARVPMLEPIPVQVDEEEVKRIKKAAMEHKKLPNMNEETCNAVLDSLVEERRQMALAKRFKDGNKITQAIDYINESRTELRKNQLQQEARQNYEQELEDFKAARDNFDAETKRLLDELDAQLKEQAEKQRVDHQTELQKHQELWQSEQKIRQYNRPSSNLTIMRKQLHLLLAQCRFDEAEALQKLVDERTATEEDAAYRTMQHAFDEATKKLLAKQQAEEDFLKTSSEVQKRNLLQRRANLRRQIENKEKRIEKRGAETDDKEKLWNKAQVQRLEEITSRPRAATARRSLSISRDDIADKDMKILKLPPLVMKAKTARRETSNA